MPATLLSTLDSHLATLADTSQERRWCEDWRAAYPAWNHHSLTQVKLAAQGRSRTTEACSSRGDEIYCRLIDEHLAGDCISTTILIAAVGPMLRSLAASITPRRFPTRDDAEAAAVTALIEALPRLRRPRANLASAMRLAVLNAVAGRTAKVEALPPTEITSETISTQRLDSATSSSEHILGSVGEALELLAWGVEVGALSPPEATLLARLHVPEDPSDLAAGSPWRPDRAALAAELGCTPAALKMRTHRAIARLRQALVQAGTLQSSGDSARSHLIRL